jgi:hypothetical protein
MSVSSDEVVIRVDDLVDAKVALGWKRSSDRMLGIILGKRTAVDHRISQARNRCARGGSRRYGTGPGQMVGSENAS